MMGLFEGSTAKSEMDKSLKHIHTQLGGNGTNSLLQYILKIAYYKVEILFDFCHYNPYTSTLKICSYFLLFRSFITPLHFH
uniref:Uncharacterized protein n=1 Tax=Anguilla anguilla TaxID=7936 RepID=A0A0E9RTE0_ANGAN